MGKGKIKTYKEPEEKYVVVQSPWGMRTSLERDQRHINNVEGWFRVMVKDLLDEDDVLIDAVFTVKAQDHIIVQLPKQVNIKPLLGVHKWPEFLARPFGNANPDKESILYEYDYVRFDHPARKGWNEHTPSYERLPSAFPIKSPYPKPTLPKMPRSRFLPVRELPVEIGQASTSQRAPLNQEGPSSSQIRVKEEVSVERALQDLGTDEYQASPRHSLAVTTGEIRVKKEEPLDLQRPIAKYQASPHRNVIPKREDGMKDEELPSELVKLVAEYQTQHQDTTVKEEVRPKDDEHELAAVIAEYQSRTRHSIKRERDPNDSNDLLTPKRVKAEPE